MSELFVLVCGSASSLSQRETSGQFSKDRPAPLRPFSPGIRLTVSLGATVAIEGADGSRSMGVRSRSSQVDVDPEIAGTSAARFSVLPSARQPGGIDTEKPDTRTGSAC